MFAGGRGGVGGGGAAMFRVVGRAAVSGSLSTLQESVHSSRFSSGSSTSRPAHKRKPSDDNLSLSSSAFGPSHNPVSLAYWPPFGGACSDDDDYDWVSVGDPETDSSSLENVPTVDEVQSTVSALTHMFDDSSYPQHIRDRFTHNEERDLATKIYSTATLPHGGSSVGSELDWMEPSSYVHDSRVVHPYGSQKIYDAFHILQTEPSVQRMVVSISSDPAVWEAVMNNQVVQQLRDAYYADRNSIEPASESSEDTGETPKPALDAIRWILDNSKAKVGQVIEMITNLVNQLFKPQGGMKTAAGVTDPFEEKLRTSFMLSIVVLLIVVVTRISKPGP